MLLIMLPGDQRPSPPSCVISWPPGYGSPPARTFLQHTPAPTLKCRSCIEPGYQSESIERADGLFPLNIHNNLDQPFRWPTPIGLRPRCTRPAARDSPMCPQVARMARFPLAMAWQSAARSSHSFSRQFCTDRWKSLWIFRSRAHETIAAANSCIKMHTI